MSERMEDKSEQEFKARPFQIQLYEKAVEQNSIVYLPTGSGKTYIAVLLVKRFSEDLLKPYHEGGKRSIFVVNTVALVVQQSAFMSRHTGLNCKGYSGDMQVDFWTDSEWKIEIEENQILVMTAQICLDLINHGRIPLSKINLLIFDECHRAVGDHPMRLIMKNFEKCPKSQQPRILAMSATLLNSNVKLERIANTLKDLEATYLAKIITVESLKDVSEYSTNPREFIEFYEPLSPCGVIDKVELIISKAIKVLSLVDIPSKTRNPESSLCFQPDSKPIKLKRLLDDVMEILRDTGLYGGSKCVLLRLIQLDLIKKYTDEPKVIMLLDFIITQLIVCQKILQQQLEGLDTVDLIKNFSTDKVFKLIEIMKKFNNNLSKDQKFCCIIFVQRRFTAQVLYRILMELSKSESDLKFLKPDFIVGSNNDPFQNARELLLETKVKKDALKNFRTGKVNCLVATDVVDEGVDIPTCTLVIRYYAPSDFRAYIQSKGRARHHTSHYVILASNDAEYKKKYNSFQQMEQYLHMSLYGMTEYRPIPSEDEINRSLYTCNIEPYIIERSDGTTSVITEQTAISLINLYCASLMKSKFIMLTPTWVKECINTPLGTRKKVYLTLPPISPLKDVIESDEMESVDLAKRSAAVKACIKLYEIGQLDDNLLPTKIEDTVSRCTRHLFPCWIDEEITNGIPGTSGKKRSHRIIYPESLVGCYPEEGETLYLHIMEMKPTYAEPLNDNRHWTFYNLLSSNDTFAILSTKKMPELPAFPIFMNVGTLNVNLKINIPMKSITTEELNALRKFHWVIFNHVLSVVKNFMVFDPKKKENNFLVVPVDEKHQINWDVVHRYGMYQITPAKKPIVVKNSEYEKALITPSYRPSSHIYIVTDICEYLKAESKFPTEYFESYVHYFKSRHGLIIEDAKQPMLEVKPISKKINCIKPRGVKANLSKRKKANLTEDFEEHLVPELCSMINFPSLYYLKATTLPSILHRIKQLLVAEDLRVQIAQEALLSLVRPPSKWEPLRIIDQVAPSPDSTFEEELIDDDDPLTDENLSLNDTIEVDVLSQSENRLYSWTKDQEPPDLVRNADRIQLIDIEYYFQFMAGVTSEDKRNLKYQNAIKSSYVIATKVPVPPLKMLAMTDPCGPNPVDILTSLTAKVANDVFNYERVETLGDSFLKFGISLFLFQVYPDFGEGQLTFLKGKMVGNRNLFYCGQKNNIPGRMNVEDFSPMVNFITPTYGLNENLVKSFLELEISANILHDLFISEKERFLGILSNKTIGNMEEVVEDWLEKPKALQTGMEVFLGTQVVSDKTTSDCVEAIIGTYLSKLGINGALHILKWFGIFPQSFNAKQFLNCDVVDPKLGTGDIDVHMPWAASIEKTLGYQFRNRAFLLQALTHPSYQTNRVTASYQRLEFLGDAILDFFLTVHIYETCGDLSPGELTDLRSALVNNITFACLAVRYGLHTALLAFAPKLFELVDRFVKFQEGRDYVVDDELLWVLLEEEDCNMAEHVDVPKVLGDIFESIIGAIFLDSGKDFQTTWQIIYCLMKKEIDLFSKNVPKQPIRVLYETPGAHPKFSKGKLVDGTSTVMITLSINDNGKKKYFHGFGTTKKFAKCAASKQALKYLRFKN